MGHRALNCVKHGDLIKMVHRRSFKSSSFVLHCKPCMHVSLNTFIAREETVKGIFRRLLSFLTFNSQGLLLELLVGDVSPVEDVPPFCLGTDWLLSWTHWRLLKFKGCVGPVAFAKSSGSLGRVDDCCM